MALICGTDFRSVNRLDHVVWCIDLSDDSDGEMIFRAGNKEPFMRLTPSEEILIKFPTKEGYINVTQMIEKSFSDSEKIQELEKKLQESNKKISGLEERLIALEYNPVIMGQIVGEKCRERMEKLKNL